MKIPIFLLALVSITMAQEKPSVTSKDSPKVTLEQQAKWLQARAELAEARIAYAEALGKYSNSVKEIQAVCSTVVLKEGRPECEKEKQ